MSLAKRKPAFCLSENKGADQLSSNCEVDQHCCFLYMDSTIPPLLNTGISMYRAVCVGPGRKPRSGFLVLRLKCQWMPVSSTAEPYHIGMLKAKG